MSEIERTFCVMCGTGKRCVAEGRCVLSGARLPKKRDDGEARMTDEGATNE